MAGDRFLGLVLQKNPEAENPTADDLWQHGCAGRVAKMLKFPDGTVRILVEGLRRFKILEFASQTPYLIAKVEKLKDVVDDSLELTALTRNAEREFQEIIKLSPTLAEQVKIAALNTEDAAKLSDLIAANLNLSLEERQRLLEMPIVKERLTRLLPLLSRELEVLRLGSKIQNEVVTSMSRTSAISSSASRSARFSANSARSIPAPPRPRNCATRSRKTIFPKKPRKSP